MLLFCFIPIYFLCSICNFYMSKRKEDCFEIYESQNTMIGFYPLYIPYSIYIQNLHCPIKHGFIQFS